ncbi:MAG TPA: hypothetical protein VLM79_32050 [Kofleriaceae bacterium]|nr:hypothetical protein [Kofleriaceae bacterium]
MLLRLTMTCLCVAGVILLARMQPVRLEIVRPVLREPVLEADPGRAASRHEIGSLSVVDAVADAIVQMPRAELASLLALKPGEYVSSLNDRAVDSDTTLDQIFASRRLFDGEYLDLSVSSATSERRVLVLLH